MTTLEDGRYTAVIDRFEDDQAVLLIEDDTGSLVGEAVVDQAVIPEPARHPDAVLTVELEDGEVLTGEYDVTETEKRTEQVQDRFDQLSERLEPAGDEDNTDN